MGQFQVIDVPIITIVFIGFLSVFGFLYRKQRISYDTLALIVANFMIGQILCFILIAILYKIK
jgi:hypothetical protein